MAARDALEPEIETSINVAAMPNKPFTEMPGGFNILYVVHGDQGLKRRIGPFAANAKTFPRGSIEGDQSGRRGCPLPKRIETASIQCFAVILFELGRVTCRVTHRLPDAFGLIWFDGVPAHLLDQQAAHIQGGVTNHFGIE